MAITVSRVTALPATPAANTIYLVTEGSDRVRIVVTGATGTVIRSTPGWSEVSAAIDTAAAGALADAKTYSDGKLATEVSTLNSAITTGDSSVTSTLRSELATEIATALTTAAATADTKIAAAVAGLDMSTVAEFAADIAARNALTPTKNIFCLVQDATGDATVSLGAALYFYNSSNTSWTKICEYESMDVVIPNKDLIAKFSDVAGVLHYDGQSVGTVIAGSTEW